MTKMVQEAYTYVDQITNMEQKLQLIDTLRTVTAGKVKFFLQMILTLVQVILFVRFTLKLNEQD